MPYPYSSDVIAGETTQASQYNNLRKDALYLGADPNGSAPVRDILVNKRPEISKIGSATLAVTASAAAPVSVVVEGKILTNTQTVTLTVDNEGMPNACGLNLFAADNTTGGFGLSAHADATPAAGEAWIGAFDWTGTHIVSGSFRYQTGRCYENINGGKLTLQSNTPNPGGDVNGGTVYYTPYTGEMVSLYNGTEWHLYTFQEISIGLTNYLTGIILDIFIQLGAGGPELIFEEWTTPTRLSGSLVWNNGILVSSVDTRRKYIGTVGIDSAGKSVDSVQKRLLWNQYNRIPLKVESLLQLNVVAATTFEKWEPYLHSYAPSVKTVIGTNDGILDLNGVGGHKTEITAGDISNGVRIELGICRDMSMSHPYTGNENAVSAKTASCGNDEMKVRLIENTTGMHTWTLAIYSSYSNVMLYSYGNDNTVPCQPGLYGMIR